MDAVEENYAPLPLPYAAALAGFVAVLGVLLFMVAIGMAGRAGWPFLAMVFTPVCGVVVVVMVIAGSIMGGLIRLSGLTSRWLYVAGAAAIFGFCSLLFPMPWRIALAALVPAAAIPSGLVFHQLVRPERSFPRVGWGDALIIATWIAAFIFCWAALSQRIPYFVSVPASAPDYGRFTIAGTAASYGVASFMLCGIAAGFVRLRSLRLGIAVAGLAWLIPVAFAIVIALTSLGPEKLHFAIGEREFDIDWHLLPQQTASGFCFDAAGDIRRPPYRLHKWRICVSEIGEPLETPASGDDVHHWDEAGLSCADATAGKIVCSVADAEARPTARVTCESGLCTHLFDDHGLRYRFYASRDHLATWRALQERVLRVVSDASAGVSSVSGDLWR